MAFVFTCTPNQSVFQESDTASAMTTLTTATTSTAFTHAQQQHAHPLTSESACVNIGGNAMIVDTSTALLQPSTEEENNQRRDFGFMNVSNITATNTLPGALPAEHLHAD